MRLTLIWQNNYFPETSWIKHLFSPFASEEIVDNDHRVVMDDCLLIDSYLHCQPREYYKQFRGKNAWLLHASDETYEGGYEAYENFRGVFRFYRSGIFNPRKVMQIPLGHSSGFHAGTVELGTARRPYLWSTVGAAGKGSRPDMLKALLPLTPHFAHITDRGNVGRISKEEYAQILRDSIFVPSPMGNVNLECFRMYEALECGAIPILEKRIGLDYFTHLLGEHPMPSFTNWRKAARFVEAIRNDRAALDRLQLKCFQWWIDYKSRLHDRISDFFEHPPVNESGNYVRWQRAIPGSQVVELMRHHTVPALARRVRLQVGRLFKEGKLRKTTGA